MYHTVLVDFTVALGLPVRCLCVGPGTRRGLCWLSGMHMQGAGSPGFPWLERLHEIGANLDTTLIADHLPRLNGLGNYAHPNTRLKPVFHLPVMARTKWPGHLGTAGEGFKHRCA